MAQTQDQSEVIAFLSSPEAFDGTGAVERVDTHGAVVFLSGERVFKLKRAVKYAYLDFSTEEKRRQVCEEELRLNRRTAPELYCSVRSVNRQADGALGFGPGEPVDWIIEMRRFDAEDLLEQVAKRGELTADLTRRLADRIAEFHASAEIIDGASGSGKIRHILEGNRDSMAGFPEVLDDARCDALYQRSAAELETLAALLDKRAKAGKIRHCHGDLHLANICIWKGEPTLFDCLEFDPELAQTDVLYDLAFLVMDLWEHGLRSQASLLFNRYFDMTGEREGAAALPLFLSARAAIRAHVAALAAGQKDEAEEAEAKRQEAQDYLAAATGFLDQPPARLIAVGGLSGTGKSTLAGALAPDIGGAPGARWLRTDVFRKRMAGVAPEDPLPPESYTPEHSDRVYRRIMEEALGLLKAGRSVIVDGVLADPAERDHAASVAAKAGTDFQGIWLEAPAEKLKQRVSARRGDASDATAEVVERQLARDLGDLSGWLRLDASGTPEEVRAAAIAMIERR